MADTAKSSGSGAGLALSESKMPNSQERITWLKRGSEREFVKLLDLRAF
jgi:hypothetical protein